MKRLLLAVILLTSVTFCIGCGAGAIPKKSLEEKQVLFDDTMAKMTARNYSAAKEAAMQALAGGGLTADQASEVSLVLIESSIRTGDLDGAAKELPNALMNSMDQAKVYTLQAMLARKRGNEAEAAAAMEKAVQINPESVFPE